MTIVTQQSTNAGINATKGEIPRPSYSTNSC